MPDLAKHMGDSLLLDTTCGRKFEEHVKRADMKHARLNVAVFNGKNFFAAVQGRAGLW